MVSLVLLWHGTLGDDTSVSSMYFGEEAVGGVPLSIASEPSESFDEDCSVRDLAGLQKRRDSMR